MTPWDWPEPELYETLAWDLPGIKRVPHKRLRHRRQKMSLLH